MNRTTYSLHWDTCGLCISFHHSPEERFYFITYMYLYTIVICIWDYLSGSLHRDGVHSNVTICRWVALSGESPIDDVSDGGHSAPSSLSTPMVISPCTQDVDAAERMTHGCWYCAYCHVDVPWVGAGGGGGGGVCSSRQVKVGHGGPPPPLSTPPPPKPHSPTEQFAGT